MDEQINRLKRAAVLAETHGVLVPVSWAAAKRRDLIDGMVAITEDQDGDCSPSSRVVAAWPS